MTCGALFSWITKKLINCIIRELRLLTGCSIYTAIARYRQLKYSYKKKRFQLFESDGIVLPVEERIRFLTRQTISKTEIEIVKNYLDNLSLNYLPTLNRELANSLRYWKTKQRKIALLSNTGLISSHITKEYLKKYHMLKLFDELFFSEEELLCKPDIRFFIEQVKK